MHSAIDSATIKIACIQHSYTGPVVLNVKFLITSYVLELLMTLYKTIKSTLCIYLRLLASDIT